MVKKVETYRCGICGREYSTEENAVACEKSHPKLISVSQDHRRSGYHYPLPVFLRATYEDGTIVEYVWSKGRRKDGTWIAH